MKKESNNEGFRLPPHKNVLRQLSKMIRGIFRLEEVEVVFDEQTKSYTYRVISNK